MASPQTENGYTKIANELFDELCRLHLSGNEWSYLHALIRKTYGFQKKEDWVTNSQIALLTGMRKERVSEAKRLLVGKNIVTENRNSRISLQKDYDKWIKLRKNVTKRVLQKSVTGVTENRIPSYGKSYTQKKLLQKKHTKERKPPAPEIEKKFLFGEFKNVSLSLTEKEKLKEVYGRGKALELVEALGAHLKSIGKDKYASHYATIRNWARRDKVPEIEKPKKVKVEPERELTEAEKERNAEMRRKISESIKNKFKKP